MCSNRSICLCLLLLAGATAFAQKAERDYIRKGNRSYADSSYVDAEVNYRKALEANPKSTVAMFNLGNTLLRQTKVKEALQQYVSASRIEKNKSSLGQIYHNIGVVFHSQRDYAKAVEAYKEALRNNPSDDETRYNLALAQKQLNDQQQQQQQQQDQQQKQEQQQQQQQEQQQQEQQQQQDQQQEQQQGSQQQQKENQMSRENAEQLLRSVVQDEKDVQEKVKRQQMQQQGRRLEKDW